MRTVLDVLKVLGVLVAGLLGLALLAAGLILAGQGQLLPLLLFLMLAVVWMGYAFFRYRQVRQDELLQVLAMAVEAQLPLGPAIRAYLQDRPGEGTGGTWDAVLMVLLLPGF